MSEPQPNSNGDRETIAELPQALVGPGADDFLLMEQGPEVPDDPEAEVVVVDEEEARKFLATFGVFWDAQGKRIVISGPPQTVERIVAMLILGLVLVKLIERLP